MMIGQMGDGRRLNPLTRLTLRRDSLRVPIGEISKMGYRVRSLGDATILGRDQAPMVAPMVQPMIRPMVRRMGESAIEFRRRGNLSVLEGTPLVAFVGSPDVVDLSLKKIFRGVERVGWEWTKKGVCAYVTRDGKTYRIQLTAGKVRSIFNDAFERIARGTMPAPISANRATVGDIFSDIGDFFTKEIPRGVSEFFNDPGKWIEEAVKDLGVVVADIAKVGKDIISSPIFAGVMSVLAAIPPLTAIGGPGLAAFAAAQAVGPAIDVGAEALKTWEQGGDVDPGKLLEAGLSAAGQMGAGQALADNLPPGAKKALQAGEQALQRGGQALQEGAADLVQAGADALDRMNLTTDQLVGLVEKARAETAAAQGFSLQDAAQIPAILLVNPDGKPYPPGMSLEERKNKLILKAQLAKVAPKVRDFAKGLQERHGKKKAKADDGKPSLHKPTRGGKKKKPSLQERKAAQAKRVEEAKKRKQRKLAAKTRESKSHKASVAKAGRGNARAASQYGRWIAKQALLREHGYIDGPFRRSPVQLSEEKAVKVMRSVKSNLRTLPGPWRKLMIAALKGLPAPKVQYVKPNAKLRVSRAPGGKLIVR